MHDFRKQLETVKAALMLPGATYHAEERGILDLLQEFYGETTGEDLPDEARVREYYVEDFARFGYA